MVSIRLVGLLVSGISQFSAWLCQAESFFYFQLYQFCFLQFPFQINIFRPKWIKGKVGFSDNQSVLSNEQAVSMGYKKNSLYWIYQISLQLVICTFSLLAVKKNMFNLLMLKWFLHTWSVYIIWICNKSIWKKEKEIDTYPV